MGILSWERLVAMRLLRVENGDIDLMGRYGIIMPADVVLHLRELLEPRVGAAEAAEIVFRAGLHQTSLGTAKYLKGRDDFRTLFERLDATGDPSLEMGREMLSVVGLGDIRFTRVEPEGRRLVLSTSSSPFALEHLKTRGRGKGPVCDYMRGVLAGAMGAYYRKSYAVVETVCKAGGLSEECVFELKERPGPQEPDGPTAPDAAGRTPGPG